MLRQLFKMAALTASKRLKTEPPVIGTHNGFFHADEALAVYMLRMLPEYNSAPLVRTRDQTILDRCHTVVDVGGEYDQTKNRYDHHQRTFSTTFPEHRTKLSSAGLIYMHFGKAIIAQQATLALDHPDVALLYQKLYDDFIEAVDAHDNGIDQYDAEKLEQAGVEKRFKAGGVTLASLVADMNHEDPSNPDAPSRNTADQPQAEEDFRFSQASTLMGNAFLRKLYGAVTSWLPARAIVKEAYANRFKSHPSGKIMTMPRAGVPWKEHLYNLENETTLSSDQQVLFVVYPENEEPGSRWRVQAVPKNASSFESRKGLPELWRGLREKGLDTVLGEAAEDGAIFVHASGFIGGHRTEKGARAMASMALEP